MNSKEGSFFSDKSIHFPAANLPLTSCNLGSVSTSVMAQIWAVPWRLISWGLDASWWALGKWLNPEVSDWINGVIPCWIHNIIGRWGLARRVGHWRHALKRYILALVPSCSVLSLLVTVRWHFCSPTPFCHNVLPHHRPRNNGASQPLTVASETMNIKIIFSIKLFLSCICTAMKKSNTHLYYRSYLEGWRCGSSSGAFV
jgi:hypothetical protein